MLKLKNKALYWNKMTTKWEDSKTTPYLKSEKVWNEYLDKIVKNTSYNPYKIMLKKD